MSVGVKWRYHEARYHVKAFAQRHVHGWADADIWNFDAAFAKRTGGQLLELAEILHGYPDGTTFEEWLAQIRKAGNALVKYSNMEWYETGHDGIYEEAQEALRWIADHLGQLWD